MKLLRPLAGYTLRDHKTNDFMRRELKITGILDKIDEYRLNTCKECHITESRWNYTTRDHKEGEQLEDRRNFFFSNATTCPLRLRGPPLRLWLKCNRLLRLGHPVGAVTLSRWEWWWDERWIWGASGGLKTNCYQLPRPWSPWASSPFKEKRKW